MAKKQTLVAKSSIEAEYKALAYTAMNVMWLNMLLTDLQITPSRVPQIYCDNLSAIAISANPILYSKTKHIAIDFHFVWERVQSNQLAVLYITSSEQIADVFTKSLSSRLFKHFKDKLMITPTIILRGYNKDTKDESVNKFKKEITV